MGTEILGLLNAIKRVGSKIEKERLLRIGIGDVLFCRVLVAAMDPYRTYGIKALPDVVPSPDAKSSNNLERAALEELLDLLDVLRTREATGNAAKKLIANHLSSLTAPEMVWHQRILRKDLDIGVGATVINKIQNGLIPSFEVALASPLKSLDNLAFPVWGDLKLDGHRCVAFKKDGKVTLLNRKGHEVTERLPEIVQELSTLEGDFVLDGEAMGRNWNETQTVMSKDDLSVDRSNMHYCAFDKMTYAQWIARSTHAYSDRRHALEELLGNPSSPHVVAIPGKVLHNIEEIQAYFKEALEAGHEGIMLKDFDAQYQWKRSKAILKLKPTETWEGMIVDWEKGKEHGKHASTFGAFLVHFKPGGPVTSVGGGYTDAERADIFAKLTQDADAFEGKVIEVKGQEMTKDGLVRFPVFVRFRTDGDVS